MSFRWVDDQGIRLLRRRGRGDIRHSAPYILRPNHWTMIAVLRMSGGLSVYSVHWTVNTATGSIHHNSIARKVERRGGFQGERIEKIGVNVDSICTLNKTKMNLFADDAKLIKQSSGLSITLDRVCVTRPSANLSCLQNTNES